MSFPGVQTKRDSFLVDIDLTKLKTRIADYFNAGLGHEEIAQLYPVAMKNSSGFVVPDARLVRDGLLARGGPDESGFVRHSYRPFDTRWLYWDTGRGLIGRPVPEYRPHVFEGEPVAGFTAEAARRDWSPSASYCQTSGCLDLMMISGVYVCSRVAPR